MFCHAVTINFVFGWVLEDEVHYQSDHSNHWGKENQDHFNSTAWCVQDCESLQYWLNLVELIIVLVLRVSSYVQTYQKEIDHCDAPKKDGTVSKPYQVKGHISAYDCLKLFVINFVKWRKPERTCRNRAVFGRHVLLNLDWTDRPLQKFFVDLYIIRHILEFVFKFCFKIIVHSQLLKLLLLLNTQLRQLIVSFAYFINYALYITLNKIALWQNLWFFFVQKSLTLRSYVFLHLQPSLSLFEEIVVRMPS